MGITKQTIAAAHQAGADTFVAGHAVFREGDPGGSAGAAPPLHGDGMTNRQQWTADRRRRDDGRVRRRAPRSSCGPNSIRGDRVARAGFRRHGSAREQAGRPSPIIEASCAAQHLGDVCPPAARKAVDGAPAQENSPAPNFRIAAVSVDGDAFYAQEQAGPKEIMAFASTWVHIRYPARSQRRDSGKRTTFSSAGSYLIYRDGVIVKRVIGAADWEDPVNEMLIRRLLMKK